MSVWLILAITPQPATISIRVQSSLIVMIKIKKAERLDVVKVMVVALKTKYKLTFLRIRDELQ